MCKTSIRGILESLRSVQGGYNNKLSYINFIFFESTLIANELGFRLLIY